MVELYMIMAPAEMNPLATHQFLDTTFLDVTVVLSCWRIQIKGTCIY